MKTRAKDRIRLPDGNQLTLGEALDRGLVVLIESRYYDPPRYFATDLERSVSWEVNQTLYNSRLGLPLGIERKKF